MPMIGEPPNRLAQHVALAWTEIACECPPVLRAADAVYLELVAITLAAFRRGHAVGLPVDRASVRTIYRMLGGLFVPMAARRRLLFGNSVPPSRSRRT